MEKKTIMSHGTLEAKSGQVQKISKKPLVVKSDDDDEDPNAKWTHALPLEDTKLWKDKAAEAGFMKDLILNKLPIGEDTDHIHEYFNRLEKAISTKEPIDNDNFDYGYDEIDVDGAVDQPPEQYQYFSADLLKQQASKPTNRQHANAIEAADDVLSSQQDVETSPPVSVSDDISNEHSNSDPSSYVSFSQNSDDSEKWSNDN